MPTFTIFLPVRNGGRYLPLCVESILGQSCQDFNLVILENQSTDGTAEWVQNIAKEDDRITVIPSKAPLSIEENWKRILSVPKKEFMTIIGHDDMLEENFLEVISNIIQEKPEANLYSTHFNLIDAEGQLLRPCKPVSKYETASEFIAARFAEIRDSFGTGYVMRSVDYEKIGGIPDFDDLLFADDALWVSLIGNKFKVTSANVCFSYRFHCSSVSGAPNRDALFNGLSNYLNFLDKISVKQKNVSIVLEMYGSQFILKRCNYYRQYLVKNMSENDALVDNKLLEVDTIIRKYVGDCRVENDSSFSNAKHGIWYRTRLMLSKVKKKLTI
jgi:glycosyltransferase involved in cell wall biosynthesis